MTPALPTGVGNDLYFSDHRGTCKRCDEAERQRRYADLCLEGAVLWKRENEKIVRRPKTNLPQLGLDGVVEKNYRGTKAQVKALTRYVGDE